MDRGGKATCHGPGQLVAYPILKLQRRDLHRYIDQLLAVLCAVIEGFGLRPERRDGNPGVWVDAAKIASVGVAVRKWVTYHGVALNVNRPPEAFQWIVPCGHPQERVTSLQLLLGRPVAMAAVKRRFTAEFVRIFHYAAAAAPRDTHTKHPAWLVRPAPSPAVISNMEARLARLRLATVCQDAHCPNIGECFGRGTATFMLLGTICSRTCRFCAVDQGHPGTPDPAEPERVAVAAERLALSHVVLTSVTRDDLPDGGAGHFCETIARIRQRCPAARVEALVPDFKGAVPALQAVCDTRLDVFNHNIETVARLYSRVRPQADYRRSLGVLEYAARQGLAVKSGIMLGLGEREAEIVQTLWDLRRTGCRYLTIGQYLAPSPRHHPVARFVTPEEFDRWRQTGQAIGFTGIAAGPLVRSSYRAQEMFAGWPLAAVVARGANKRGEPPARCA